MKTTPVPTARASDLQDIAADARRWLFDSAAPLWSTVGRLPNGMLAERLTRAGTADDAPRRLFVQARHIYAFCAIGRLGWDGPWRTIAHGALDHLLAQGRRADGLFIHTFSADGAALDTRADLYDQAFMLFCLGHAATTLGRPELLEEAARLISVLERDYAHPAGGFIEPDMPRAFRQQNPHMHFLEAFAALHAHGGGEVWKARALALADLGRARFIDAASGAVTEAFTDDLEPAPGLDGTVVEPGHCFEWAWLLEGLAQEGLAQEGLAQEGWPGVALSDRLTGFARAHGIDPARGVAINEVTTSGAVRKGSARLWPQTERLKAALARWRRLGTAAEAEEARRAYAGLKLYLQMPVPGTWQDVLNADGSWVEMPAPGSSFYHITCALAELVETAHGRL